MSLDPIRVAVTVPRDTQEAFNLFTARVADWWPAHTHSIGEERVTDVVIEPREGGRMYEVLDDGTEHEWGIVEAFEPPHRLLVRWRVNRDMPDYTEWEVNFSDAGGGQTRVALEHRGWERLREHAERARALYDRPSGWRSVIDLYAAHIGSLV